MTWPLASLTCPDRWPTAGFSWPISRSTRLANHQVQLALERATSPGPIGWPPSWLGWLPTQPTRPPSHVGSLPRHSSTITPSPWRCVIQFRKVPGWIGRRTRWIWSLPIALGCDPGPLGYLPAWSGRVPVLLGVDPDQLGHLPACSGGVPVLPGVAPVLPGVAPSQVGDRRPAPRGARPSPGATQLSSGPSCSTPCPRPHHRDEAEGRKEFDGSATRPVKRISPEDRSTIVNRKG